MKCSTATNSKPFLFRKQKTPDYRIAIENFPLDEENNKEIPYIYVLGCQLNEDFSSAKQKKRNINLHIACTQHSVYIATNIIAGGRTLLHKSISHLRKYRESMCVYTTV